MAYKYLLLVEGKDDQHVFYALLRHHQVPEVFEIMNKEGIDNLLEALPTELKRSDLERLGIVVDANTSLDARWTNLRNILLRAGGKDIPAQPDPNGTVVAVEQPDRTLTVGIWIMPDNTLPGMLENFIGFLVPPGDTLWPRAGECIAQIPEAERRFPQAQQTKAHIHTWLAWQEEPGTPLGLAITKRYLDADAPHAQQLVDWIRHLFDLG
jgi:hypothetical protein